MDSEQRQRGKEQFERVMGFAAPDIEEPYYETTLDHLFANIWSRGGLSQRERRLISLTAIACYGNEAAMRLHVRAARRSGDLSDADIDEFVLHLAHYAGWPAGALASGVARQVRSDKQ